MLSLHCPLTRSVGSQVIPITEVGEPALVVVLVLESAGLQQVKSFASVENPSTTYPLLQEPSCFVSFRSLSYSEHDVGAAV